MSDVDVMMIVNEGMENMWSNPRGRHLIAVTLAVPVTLKTSTTLVTLEIVHVTQI